MLFLEKKLLSGHDVSDGGLITTILEMCFGGVIGVNVNITHKTNDPIAILFAEEVGWVLEVDDKDLDYVMSQFKESNVPCFKIGNTNGFGMNSGVRNRIQILFLKLMYDSFFLII